MGDLFQNPIKPAFALGLLNGICRITLQFSHKNQASSGILKLNYCKKFSNSAIMQFYLQASFGRREWKGIKRIILEYSSIPLFGSFNGGNGKLIPLFGSLSGREWNEQREHSFLSIPLKPQIFIPPDIGRNRRE